MQKLEKRIYSRQEVAEITGVNLKDTRHFKRNVCSTLVKWGYELKYTTKQIEITKCPSTTEEEIREYVVRLLETDKQIDARAFGIFFFLLCNDFEFSSAPWMTKAKIMEDDYCITVAESTLRKWAAKLTEKNLIVKGEKNNLWVTEWVFHDGDDQPTKEQRFVDLEDVLENDAYEQYCGKRKELLEKYKDEKDKWSKVIVDLIHTFSCYYYKTGDWMSNAFESKVESAEYFRLFELCDKLILEIEEEDSPLVICGGQVEQQSNNPFEQPVKEVIIKMPTIQEWISECVDKGKFEF